MKYILLPDIIINLENLKEFRMLGFESSNIDKILSRSSFSPNDYKSIIGIINEQVSGKKNVSLIVSTFYYHLPFFIELLNSVCKNIKAIPLFQLAVNSIPSNKASSKFVELYDEFKITIKYSNQNNIIIIESQKIERTGFKSKINSKIENGFNIETRDEQRSRFLGIEGINEINQKFSQYNPEYLEYANLYPNISLFKENSISAKYLYDSINATIYESIDETEETCVFSVYLFLNHIDNFFNTISTSIKAVSTANFINEVKRDISFTEANYLIETLPESEIFKYKYESWMLLSAENENKLVVEKTDDIGVTKKSLSLEECKCKDLHYSVGQNNLIKVFLKAQPDPFKNLHFSMELLNGKQMYNLIVF